MVDFTKLAAYLDAFEAGDQDYDLVCYLKAKISQDLQDRETINNGDEENLDDNDVTMSTPDQQAASNLEGDMMAGAFGELDVLNQLKEEKEEIKIPDKEDPEGNKSTDASTEEHFGDNVQNQKQSSLFEALQKRIKK